MLERRLLDRLNHKKNRLDELRPLSPEILARLRKSIDLEWTYNSNAIEGSTMTLQETRLVLEIGLTIGGKSLREHFEVINHQQAINFVEDLVGQKIHISAFNVRQIHKLVMTGIDNKNTGTYRETPVRIAGVDHIPPKAWQIPSLMAAWDDWLVQALAELHPVETAALAHHRLAAIHPFLDGNGRTARLVMNLVLMLQDYPPVVIERVIRKGYYRVLAQADGGRYEPMVNFVGRAEERSLILYLEAFTPQTSPLARDEQWIPLRQAARGSPYSQEYLSLLARKGRLEALKRGRDWYTTRRALQAYIDSL